MRKVAMLAVAALALTACSESPTSPTGGPNFAAIINDLAAPVITTADLTGNTRTNDNGTLLDESDDFAEYEVSVCFTPIETVYPFVSYSLVRTDVVAETTTDVDADAVENCFTDWVSAGDYTYVVEVMARELPGPKGPVTTHHGASDPTDVISAAPPAI